MKQDKHKTAEAINELTRQNKRLAIINQIAKSINVQMSYADIIEQVAEPLRSVIAYDLLSFCLIEEGALVIKSGVPYDQEVLGVGTVLPYYNSAPWQAIERKSCFLRQDIWNDTEKYQEDGDLRKIGIRSAIMAPLFVNNEVIGTLNLGSKLSYAFSEKDFVFVQQLADQLAVSIQNMHLYSEVYNAKKEWETTFQAVLDHIFLLDSSRCILQVNNAINGMTPEEMTGKICSEVFPFCNEQCRDCPVEKTFQTGENFSREINLPGMQRILSVHTSPVFNEEGKLYCMVVYLNDITEKKQMEVQLFQSAKLAAIGEMAAGAAHELNSPLTAIIGNASLLLRRTSPEENTTYKLLGDIKNCGQRCQKTIRNLLTFARQDNYKFEQVSINHIIKNSLSLVRYQIQKSNINIKEYLAGYLPSIMGNSQQLEQIIVNLLLNARDALDDVEDNGDREITITSQTVEYGWEPAIEVAVIDSGSGIEPENIEHIFNPFFTTKTSQKGTGLGLSVSMGIAETHGGTIKVKSEPGKGSKFSLILPL